MATMTINVDDETNSLFRKVVKEEIGESKGTLGLAVQEALRLWIIKKQEAEIQQRQLALLKRGFKLGKYKFNREEVHERYN